MAYRASFVLLLLSCLTSVLISEAFAAQEAVADSQVAELLKLQQRSSDGVISMGSEAFSKYITGRARTFSAFVFSSALHLMDKPNLRLRDLRAEFGYLGKAVKSDKSLHGKVFLVEIEYVKSQEVFARLSTKSLPYIFHIAPQLSVEGGGPLKLGTKDAMQPSTYQNYPWTANDMGDFLAELTGLKPAHIVRPSIVTHWAFPLLVLSALAGGGAVAYKLYYAPFMKNPVIWAAGILAVYLFSVSGGMHNIIRGVPMQHIDPRSGKVVLFVNSGQTQLGAEGFIMGTLFTTVGLSVALLTHGAPHFPEKMQRPLAVGVLLVAMLAYWKVKDLYLWKTGYRPRLYI